MELSLPGAKVPGNESSRERKFQELSLPGAKVLGAKVLGTFTPGSESSWERKFLELSLLSTPWYFRSRERKFLGAKVPVTGTPTKFLELFRLQEASPELPLLPPLDGLRVFFYGYFICQPLITAYSVKTSFIDCSYSVWVFHS